MAKLDRVIRRAQDCFDPFEGLVGAVLGRERGGHRRVAVVASDHRVLLVTLRPEPAVEFAYTDLQVDVTISEGSASIHLQSRETVAAVDRITDVTGAQLLLEMIERRMTHDPRPVAPSRIALLPSDDQVGTG